MKCAGTQARPAIHHNGQQLAPPAKAHPGCGHNTQRQYIRASKTFSHGAYVTTCTHCDQPNP